MGAPAKPWELDLENENESDSRVTEETPKETDRLLPEKASGKTADANAGCDYSLGAKPFIENLQTNFGSELLWLLFAAQWLLKGFSRDFVGRAEPYIYKAYHVPATRMQVFQGVTSLPWAMKPIIGLMSDLFPIRGYNKAPYIFISSAVGVGCLLIVGFTSTSSFTVGMLVLCFIMIQMQASVADLLSEAKYAERIKQIPKQGPELLTFVWAGLQVGGLLAVVLSGVAIARMGPRSLYAIAALPAGAVLIPVALNYMEESKLTSQQASEKWTQFMAQGETAVLCGLMLLGTLTLTVVGLRVESTSITAVVAIIVSGVVLIGFSILLSPTIAKFNAFSLIQTSLSMQVGGAAFYFYTDTPEEYAEGPHFSPFFFNSVVGVVSAIVSLLGIYSYHRYMTTWRYRNIFIMTNLIGASLCVPDIIMFSRYNLVLGIPDHIFMLGSSVAQNIVGTWQWMPQVVILSNLCPKGMEATMMALLAGSHNLGITISGNCGALMLEWLGCTPSGAVGEGDKFKNLWKASAISSALPLLTILALFWLIPDGRQDEGGLLDDNSDGSATKGSLWRRWTGTDVH